MNRRRFIVGAGAGATLGMAGCLGVITGEEPAEFEASPSSVSQATLDDTGYEQTAVEEVVIEDEVEAGGESRDVVVTNYQAEYEKTIDMGPLGEQRGAVFTALTTPQVSVLGREFNPVGDMTPEELAEMVQDQYEGLDDIQHLEDGEVTIQGELTVQSKFSAEAEFEGQSVPVYLHVSEAAELGDDLVVTVGAYPEMAPEEENVIALMESVESDA